MSEKPHNREQLTIEARPQDTVNSFVTSNGSIYVYDEKGYTTRFKSSTEEMQPRQDITVFFKFVIRDLGSAATAYLTKSSVKSAKVFVGELQPNGDYRIINDVKEVNQPDQLIIATFKGDRIARSKPASLFPSIGSYVFDSRQFEDDGRIRTERHLGHKVTEIRYKD